jgi:rhodanese-related sulfurtransferase
MRQWKNIRCILLIGFCWVTQLCAQPLVKGKAYGILLKTLLSHNVPEISAQNLSKDPSNYILLDSREAKEFNVSHLSGAIHIGYDEFNISSVSLISKDSPIIIYCSVGYRSEKVSEKLISAGYTDVHNLYGGIFEWMNQGNAVIDSIGETNKVHVYNATWGIWCDCDEKISD